MVYMGQHLINPPSVEGWNEGTEWVDTGTLVERVNLAAQQLGDLSKPGVFAMVQGIKARLGPVISPRRLVDGCLDQMGAISVSSATRSVLIAFASQQGDLALSGHGADNQADRRVVEMIQLVAATHEFQRA